MSRNIISCSRRTDIPALYTPWFLNRLSAGYCHVKNPFGPQITRVSLDPGEVAGIVFWTRFPKPLLPHLKSLRAAGYESYFLFTINGYPRAIEATNPPVERQVQVFRELAESLPGRVYWRYDPVLISAVTSPEYHARQFSRLATELAGYTTRCYISFTVWYRKTRSHLVAIDHEGAFGFQDPELDQRRRLAVRFADLAAERGIQLYSCCHDALLQPGIEKAHCIDASLFADAAEARLKPTREDCGCVQSVDIGAYGTCTLGCSYCYATRDHAAARQARAAHDPNDTILFRTPSLRQRVLE